MCNPVSEIIPDLHVNEETTHYIVSEENINVSAEEIVCPEPPLTVQNKLRGILYILFLYYLFQKILPTNIKVPPKVAK